MEWQRRIFRDGHAWTGGPSHEFHIDLPSKYNGVGRSDPSFNVILTFQTKDANPTGPIVDINVVTFHWEYHKEHTPAFAQLLARVPKWAFAVPAVASLHAWTF